MAAIAYKLRKYIKYITQLHRVEFDCKQAAYRRAQPIHIGKAFAQIFNLRNEALYTSECGVMASFKFAFKSSNAADI